jgi:hypothetical protein
MTTDFVAEFHHGDRTPRTTRHHLERARVMLENESVRVPCDAEPTVRTRSTCSDSAPPGTTLNE